MATLYSVHVEKDGGESKILAVACTAEQVRDIMTWILGWGMNDPAEFPALTGDNFAFMPCSEKTL